MGWQTLLQMVNSEYGVVFLLEITISDIMVGALLHEGRRYFALQMA